MDQTILFITALVGAGLVVVGTAMIVSAAFNKSLLWGLVGLVPLVNITYVVNNWKEGRTRNGLLISIIGFLLFLVSLYGGAEDELNKTLTTAGVDAPEIRMPIKAPGDAPIPNEDEAREAGVDTSVSVLEEPDFIDPKELATLPPKGSVPGPAKKVERAYQPVCPEWLGRYVGKGVRISTRSGKQVEGFVDSVAAGALYLRKHVHGGTVNFEYPLYELKKIEIFDEVKGTPRRTVNCAPSKTEVRTTESDAPAQAAPEASGTAPSPATDGTPPEPANDAPEAPQNTPAAPAPGAS